MSTPTSSFADDVSTSASDENISNIATSAPDNVGSQQQTPGDLERLGMTLLKEYREQRDLSDLGATVKVLQQSVDFAPEGNPNRAGRRKQDAVGLTPEGYSDRADCLQSLAVSFTDQYRRLENLEDLETALQLDQAAVDLAPERHPDRADRLQSLAASFGNRYQRLGNLDDLEAALTKYQEAVELTPEGHPDRADRLQSLAISFTDRYERLGDLDDLQTALQLDQAAVDVMPEGHPDRADWLQNLAASFGNRYQRLGNLDDLEAALKKYQEAVELTPEGHPDRADRLQSLAVSFRDRYERLGHLDDLETALRLDQAAVDLTPEGHPDRAGCLQNLAVSFTDRYRKLYQLNDLESVHTHYTASFAISPLIPENSWNAALTWASVSEEFKSANCITAYSNAFKLLPEILWIGNILSVRHEAIRRLDIEQVTSAAARTCINFLKLISAVEIMEQGLGLIFQQMLQLRTDLDELPPDQAQKLQFLSSKLYSGKSSDPRYVAIKRQDLLKEIRQQPHLKYFLLPKPYKDLRCASQGGPVIILTSHQDHCDGIIILNPNSDPAHVSLPTVTIDLLQAQQATLKTVLGHCSRVRGESASTRLFGHQEGSSKTPFKDMLAWLWIHIVAPVYEVLKSHGINHGRLWWLPTGTFTKLPLHACAPTDAFIHSYTPTLGALLDAYGKKSSAVPKVSVVGVTQTGGGRNYLEGVEQEVKNILSIIKNTPVESLEGEHATVDAVKLQLQHSSWVHLACHGTQDLVQPNKSHLLLYGGNLEMETILQMPLSNAEFVFLAACQTAMGDAQLVNESFHLGGGFIAAGFRSAIGTMWSMNDSDGPLVAKIFYSHLFREGRQPEASDAAEALQLAVKELKARNIPYERWIPFIHMGI